MTPEMRARRAVENNDFEGKEPPLVDRVAAAIRAAETAARDAALEEAAEICRLLPFGGAFSDDYEDGHAQGTNRAAAKIRSLKSTPDQKEPA